MWVIVSAEPKDTVILFHMRVYSSQNTLNMRDVCIENRYELQSRNQERWGERRSQMLRVLHAAILHICLSSTTATHTPIPQKCLWNVQLFRCLLCIYSMLSKNDTTLARLTNTWIYLYICRVFQFNKFRNLNSLIKAATKLGGYINMISLTRQTTSRWPSKNWKTWPPNKKSIINTSSNC